MFQSESYQPSARIVLYSVLVSFFGRALQLGLIHVRVLWFLARGFKHLSMLVKYENIIICW